MNTEDIKYGYCTEFMVSLKKRNCKTILFRKRFRQDLSQYGDSLLVISDEELVKVHIHAEQPVNVLNYAQDTEA